MNSLVIAGILILWLILGYKIYGRFIEKHVIQADNSRLTPSHEFEDGVDYSPAKKTMLFGHHFSSIAGAGPILGPLLGVLYFGWLGALLWIALGSVFLGAVHDYTSLMTSIRNRGRSLADISEKTLGRRTKIIFSVFLWMALALVIAVFAVVASKTLISQPEVVIPTFGLVFIAMLFGWLIYKRGMNITLATVLAVFSLFMLIYIGQLLPVQLPDTILGISSQTFWFFTLIVYSFFASSLPVWFLLQPRDYISTWILFLGLGFGYLGLIIAHPRMNAPALTAFKNPEGGPLWPMLFVIIACGAISGFHSVVAGGTTAKQLSDERAGRPIGFGAMITEAALAGLVVFIAAAALDWLPGPSLQFNFKHLMSVTGDPINAFATGYGRLTSSIPGITLVVGTFFGMVMLNAFVLTTLDTSTRLGRFIFAEFFMGKTGFLQNRWFASAIILAAAALLGVTEGYKTIWPIFGASNQLVAALSLLVVSSFLVAHKRPTRYTLYPAAFMLATTLAALVFQGLIYVREGSIILAFVSVVLIVLAAVIIYDARGLWLCRVRRVNTNDE